MSELFKESILVLDGPRATSDKRWLIRELKKANHDLTVVDLKVKISELIINREPFFRTKMYAEVFQQALKVNKKVSKDTVVFVWKPMSAVILNWLKKISKKDYKIVSFGWLNPNKDIYYKLNKMAFESKDFFPVVNLKQNIDRYKHFYGLTDASRFLFMPDVFDDSSEFIKSNIESVGSKYFFSGGIANRDFETVIEVAKIMPDIIFVIVCDKARLTREDMPKNVTVYNNIEKDEYYKLMKQSRASLVLLQKDKASGLINICKSIQEGVFCVSSQTESVSMYFPESCQSYLVPLGDKETLANIVHELVTMDKEHYYNTVRQMQNHIHDNFSPDICVSKLLKDFERIVENEVSKN